MSDYLWDKTGEAEDDVAQLENLLGALKYQTRPLDIPANAMPAAAAAPGTHTTRPATIFSRPRLALAASLLLTLLAGMWLVTRQSEPRQNELVKVEQRNATNENKGTEAAVVSNAGTDRSDSAAGREQLKAREDEVVVLAAPARKPLRRSRPFVTKRHKSQPRVEAFTPAPREELATAAGGEGAMRWQAEQPLTAEQREATEQLMFALRLASAKLNYAQREVREIGRTGK